MHEMTYLHKDAALRKFVSYGMICIWHFLLFLICFSLVQLTLARVFIPGKFIWAPVAIIFIFNYIFLMRNDTWYEKTIEMHAKTYKEQRFVANVVPLTLIATFIVFVLVTILRAKLSPS